MTIDDTNDPEWLGWLESQKAATRFWLAGDIPDAIEVIDRYVEQNPRSDLKRQAIGFRGSIQEDAGDLIAAEQDFLAAYSLSVNPDYEGYTLLLALGDIAERLGDTPRAASWYLKSLETVLKDGAISGGSALLKILGLRLDSALNEEERRLCEQVALQSWGLLRLGGAPNLQDLLSVARQILTAHQNPGALREGS